MGLSLLDLNDDCLYHMASYLEIRDILNLSKTCKRLEFGLEPAFASYKELDTDSLDGLTLMTIREILYKTGPHVQHIAISEDFELNERFEELLEKYCVAENIVSLNCRRACFLPKRLIQIFKNLKTIQCVYISDDMSAVLSNCSNLQNLDLFGSSNLTGKHLYNLSNLQNLNLHWCENLQPEFFKNMCRKTKLVSLNIEGCRGLDYSSFETLASTQSKLENLSITYYYKTSNLSPLATLKNLKRLQIKCNNPRTPYTLICEFFQELAKHRGAELEVLGISTCSFNQKVEQAIYSLKTLKALAVFFCEHITSMFWTNLSKSSLECLFIYPLESILEADLLNLISKSETIKVFIVGTDSNVDTRRLVLRAYEITKKKERKYPLNLFATGSCIVDGMYHEEPTFGRRKEYRKIMKKLGYLVSLPEWFHSYIYFDD